MPEIDITPLPNRFAAGTTAWRLEDRGDAVEVFPRLAIGYLLGLWGVGAIVCVGGMLMFKRVGEVDPMRYVWPTLIPAIVVGAHVLAYIEYRLGVRFLFDRVNSTFTLPNAQKAWPLADVLGWQIVNDMRGQRRQNEDHSSQLIVVVQEGDIVARYLVVTGIGSSMAWRFRELVDQVAAVTPVKLVSYVEDGVENVDANS